MFKNFAERLKKEVSAAAPEKMPVKVLAPPERKFSVWIGGGILASMGTFQAMWVTKAEYEEHGVEIVNQKCGL